MTATAERVKTKRFKVIRGFHIGPDATNPKINREYKAGDIIESPMNLEHFNDPRCAENPQWAGAKKYELIPDDTNALPESALVFDKDKETLEDWLKRNGLQPQVASQAVRK